MRGRQRNAGHEPHRLRRGDFGWALRGGRIHSAVRSSARKGHGENGGAGEQPFQRNSALKDAATGPRAHRHERHARGQRQPRRHATKPRRGPPAERAQNTDERVPEVLISFLPRDDFDLLEVLRGQERGVLMVVGVAANRDQGGGQGRRGERAQARTPRRDRESPQEARGMGETVSVMTGCPSCCNRAR